MANWKSHLWSSGVAKPHEAPGLSQFERTVERLGLKEYEWASSVKLRAWVDKNAERRYVPSWLLTRWGIEVEGRATEH
jgi:hypothetical protein